jgi:BirA family biotin operon repressor/biotin-[acetyl-CoA-carboxylase] ligase
MTGRFEALDERGRLLLRRPDGALEAVSAGDVFPSASSGRSGVPAGGGMA